MERAMQVRQRKILPHQAHAIAVLLFDISKRVRELPAERALEVRELDDRDRRRRDALGRIVGANVDHCRRGRHARGLPAASAESGHSDEQPRSRWGRERQ